MKKVAVVLSGCGFKDGAEITEAVSSLISLSEAGAQYEVYAPNLTFKATNHLTDEEDGDRNVMSEASRISRGEIKNLSELNADNFDGVVFPGGFGAAKVLCTFATEGASCKVLPEAEKAILDFYNQSKPIAALCIAPALVAKVLGDKNVTVTIGNDKDTAAEIEKTGAQHEDCVVTDYVTDRETKVITTPAYMYGEAKPHEIFTGVRAALKEFIEMA